MELYYTCTQASFLLYPSQQTYSKIPCLKAVFTTMQDPKTGVHKLRRAVAVRDVPCSRHVTCLPLSSSSHWHLVTSPTWCLLMWHIAAVEVISQRDHLLQTTFPTQNPSLLQSSACEQHTWFGCNVADGDDRNTYVLPVPVCPTHACVGRADITL